MSQRSKCIYAAENTPVNIENLKQKPNRGSILAGYDRCSAGYFPHRKCAYCDAENIPLNIDHIQPRSNGGSDRVSNLTLACVRCNQQKGSREIGEFLAHDPQRLARIEAQRKAPLKDAAAVNATRWALFNSLETTGLPVEASTGGRTRWNRQRHDIPKTHALDAACVGQVETIFGWSRPALSIKCTGRGSYQRTRPVSYTHLRAHET